MLTTHQLIGPCTTLVVLGIVEVVSRTWLATPDSATYALPGSAAIYLMAVAFAAIRGGIVPGLVSAALAVAWTTLISPLPGPLLQFSHQDIVRVVIIGVTAPLMAVLVGLLKSRNDHLVQEQITRAVAETKLAEQYEREHRIAQTLQNVLLFKPSPEALPGLVIDACYEPAWNDAEIGGDFLDVLPVEGGRVALVVGDLSGKGLAAAARTAEVRFALRAFLGETWHPAQALVRLNRFLGDAQRAEGQPREGFAAVSLVVLDPASGEAVLAVAGMDSPLVLRRHGRVEEVEARGLPLGVDPEAAYEALTVRIAPGEGILLVSDGITEARRPLPERRRGGDFLDVAGLKDLAEQAMIHAGACQIAQAVLDGAKAFAGGKLKDDACVLVACRR